MEEVASSRIKSRGDYFDRYLKRLVKNGVSVRVMGDVSALPEDLRESVARVTAETAGGKNILNIGINYGGRQALVRAAEKLRRGGEEA